MQVRCIEWMRSVCDEVQDGASHARGRGETHELRVGERDELITAGALKGNLVVQLRGEANDRTPASAGGLVVVERRRSTGRRARRRRASRAMECLISNGSECCENDFEDARGNCR
jgi:hypothetical protein